MILLFRTACALLFFLISVGVTSAQIAWQPTGYPGAALVQGQMRQVEVDSKGNVYGIIGFGPTIVFTTDNGFNWTLHTGPSSQISGIESFGEKIYVSTRDQGLFTTTDLQSWTNVSLADDMLEIESIDADKGILIAKIIGDGRLQYSLAPDEPFHRLPDFLSEPHYKALTPYGKNALLYLSPSGFWSSEWGTNTWSRISDGMVVHDMTVVRDSVYIGTRSLNIRPHLYASKVGPLVLKEMLIEGSTMHFKRMYTVQDSIIVALREDSLIRRTEIHFSVNRSDLSPPLRLAGEYMNDIALTPKGQYYAATGESIYSSADFSQTWLKLSTRLEANVAEHLLALPEGVLIAATSRGFILTSTDGGDSWTEQSDLRKPITLLAMTPAGTLLVGHEGNLLASRDLGKSFVGSNQGFARRTPSSFAIGKNEKLFLGTDSGMYYSTDDGASWYMPKSFLMNIVTGSSFLPRVLSLAIDSANNGIFVGTDKGVIYSLDEGEKYESGWLSKSPIYALAVNRYGEVFAGSESISASDPNKRNFYRGRDVLRASPAWVDPSSGIGEYDLNHLMLNSKGQLISGVLFSYSAGDTWEKGSILDLGSPKRISAQAIDENDIAYVSYRDMVYKSAAPKLGRLTKPIASASAVYPNPADREINITGSEGELSVLNALGEVVLRTSAIERSIDIHHLPNGAYFCQFKTSSGPRSVPFIVAR